MIVEELRGEKWGTIFERLTIRRDQSKMSMPESRENAICLITKALPRIHTLIYTSMLMGVVASYVRAPRTDRKDHVCGARKIPGQRRPQHERRSEFVAQKLDRIWKDNDEFQKNCRSAPKQFYGREFTVLNSTCRDSKSWL